MDEELKKDVDKKADDIILKNLRTFEDDIKDVISKENISTTDILVSEQKKRLKKLETETKKALKPRPVEKNLTKKSQDENLQKINQYSHKESYQTLPPINNISPTSINQKKIDTNDIPPKSINKNFLFILISFALIALGIGIFYFSFNSIVSFFNSDQKTIEIQAPSFLITDESVTINTVNKTAREIISDIRSEIKKKKISEKNNLIEFLIIKKIKSIQDGKEVFTSSRITNADFFKLIESKANDSLIRSFDPEIAIGAHQTEDKLEPYIVMKVNSFEESYAGMLDWEEKIISEMRDIFYENLGSSQVFTSDETNIINEDRKNQEEISSDSDILLATSSDQNVASSSNSVFSTLNSTTSIEVKPTYDPTNFEDLILLNQDTRAIKNSEGKILFFYSFVNRENLIITTNSQTFDLLLKRLNISKLIR